MDKIKDFAQTILALVIILIFCFLIFAPLFHSDRLQREVMTHTYQTDSTQVIIEGKELKVTINHVNN